MPIKKMSEESNRKRSISAIEKWNSFSEEKKAAICKSRSEGAKRMWRKRSSAERREIARKIQEGKRRNADS